jgi:hypothetical protein
MNRTPQGLMIPETADGSPAGVLKVRPATSPGPACPSPCLCVSARRQVGAGRQRPGITCPPSPARPAGAPGVPAARPGRPRQRGRGATQGVGPRGRAWPWAVRCVRPCGAMGGRPRSNFPWLTVPRRDARIVGAFHEPCGRARRRCRAGSSAGGFARPRLGVQGLEARCSYRGNFP